MKQVSKVEEMVQIAQRSITNVLITGPTGSGKTQLAYRIHSQSVRKSKPFVTVNLASLHHGTFESELFGHERGAFTGADQKRVGRLEMAQGGTVFLDEVGELTPQLQARLLEFLQSRTITPVGGGREIKLDVRVIAATHRNLYSLVKKGEFREDLFHRLRVIEMMLPSLAERSDEFDEIFHDVLSGVCREVGREVLKISEGVAERFENYSWPGNFRELRNVLEYAVLAGKGPEICIQDLPSWFDEDREFSEEASPTPLLGVAEVSIKMDYAQTMAEFERKFIELALKRFQGRINHTARKIRLNKTTLLRRMKEYGFSTAQFQCP